MSIQELIEKHGKEAELEDVPAIVVEHVLRPFAIELLELVKKKGDNVPEHLCPERHRISIDKALKELRK